MTGTGEQITGPVAWYARDEPAGPWRIQACPAHGRELERHRFRHIGSRVQLPGGSARDADRCGVCGHGELLEEVERCTCEADSARCPVHQNIGCGG